ncbi:MAG: hypothetical protein DRJ66_03705 [Thermoprotei archaeon]|nr:MAG: hypothetical protein DRJ66_03705 [Thermoprotei archaeon]
MRIMIRDIIKRDRKIIAVICVILVLLMIGSYFSMGPRGKPKILKEEEQIPEEVMPFELAWDLVRCRPGGVMLTWDDLSDDDKEFLDMIEKSLFLYFWNEADPITGLVPDNTKNRRMASIAAVGFELSAICIGESHGWISYEQAYNRVLKILRCFDPKNPKVAGSHGFFYHFVDTRTGTRLGKSELSLIDTAILMCGVLHAGQHFKGTEIEKLADRIYRAVEWDWMLDKSKNLLMYSPGGVRGKGYSEYILAYILALGSPTHPIPASAYHEWAKGYRWHEYEGIRYLGAGWADRALKLYLWQTPLAWLDLREMHDKYANYWQEAIRIHLANYKYCTNYFKSKGLPPLWGWTACIGKDKYLGWATPFDGTIAPFAIIAAIPFVPKLAIPTLKFIYEEYGHRLWGSYGFYDAFNIEQNWFADVYIGIDQGMALLLLENFRTGLVWKEFMQIPYIKEGLRKAGFVKGFHPDSEGFIKDWLVIGPFEASSVEEAFDTNFINEANISIPKAGKSTKGLVWKELHMPYGDLASRYIDLSVLFEPRRASTAYAFVVVKSAKNATVDLEIWSSGLIKVWVNNELMYASTSILNATGPYRDVIKDVKLRKGNNTILVKIVCSSPSGWKFYLRLIERK